MVHSKKLVIALLTITSLHSVNVNSMQPNQGLRGKNRKLLKNAPSQLETEYSLSNRFLAYNPETENDLRDLAKLTNLKTLDLSNNSLLNLSAEMWRKFSLYIPKNIINLNLSSNNSLASLVTCGQKYTDAFLDFLNEFNNLQILDLSGNEFNRTTGREFDIFSFHIFMQILNKKEFKILNLGLNGDKLSQNLTKSLIQVVNIFETRNPNVLINIIINEEELAIERCNLSVEGKELQSNFEERTTIKTITIV